MQVHYNLPPNFKQTYTIKLAELVESGKLVKVIPNTIMSIIFPWFLHGQKYKSNFN